MSKLLRGIRGRGVIVALALAVGLVVGFAAAFLAFPGSSADASAQVDQATTQWPVNERGLSYGSSALATCPEDEPNLIQAVATNGMRGYILRTELAEVDGSNVKTPQEAMAWQAANANKVRSIPVYALDGVTVIGRFLIEPGSLVQGSASAK